MILSHSKNGASSLLPVLLRVLLSFQSTFSRICAQQVFSGCNVDEYYATFDTSDLSSWTEQDVQNLLSSTHRNVLPYTAGNDSDDDVWKALIDLDHGELDTDGQSTVHLIYRDVDVPVMPYGTPDTWNREHLWPKSLGVGYTGADFTDIHHLRPADWNVNAARGNLYFGDCEDSSNYIDQSGEQIECRIPATSEASDETASNGFVFRPPTSSRGDIARAIFYMFVRYSGSNDNELDLILTDCPAIITKSDDDETATNEMAYLSQLLEWHNADPVNDSERTRNDKACKRWQGNRNIFVDYPELVDLFFGQSKQLTGFRHGLPIYDSCNYVNNDENKNSSNVPDQTTPPVSSPVDDYDRIYSTCNDIAAGDILIVGINSDDPDFVGLVALQNLRSGLQLYMTDNAWTGTYFRNNEGAIRLTIPDDIAAGTVFGYYSDSANHNNTLYASDWQKVSGSLELSTSGDNVIVYCLLDESNEERINFLSAVSFNNEWLDPGLSDDSYGSGYSALPADLEKSGSIALPKSDNHHYIGPTDDNKNNIKRSWSDPVNWEASNSERFKQQPAFNIQSYETMDHSTTPSASAGDDRFNLCFNAYLLCLFSLLCLFVI